MHNCVHLIICNKHFHYGSTAIPIHFHHAETARLCSEVVAVCLRLHTPHNVCVKPSCYTIPIYIRHLLIYKSSSPSGHTERVQHFGSTCSLCMTNARVDKTRRNQMRLAYRPFPLVICARFIIELHSVCVWSAFDGNLSWESNRSGVGMHSLQWFRIKRVLIDRATTKIYNIANIERKKANAKMRFVSMNGYCEWTTSFYWADNKRMASESDLEINEIYNWSTNITAFYVKSKLNYLITQ